MLHGWSCFLVHWVWLWQNRQLLCHGFLFSKLLVSDMQVSLKCGSVEKLMRVEEPSRCEYTATLLTPAACTPTEVQAVQDKLAMLNQELEGDHSEL